MPTQPSPEADLEIVQSSYAAELDGIAARGQGPVLQIGSRASVLDLKAANWRQRFAGKPFIGMDMLAGDNVDVVADICGEFRALRDRLRTFQFNCILCAHVLEHVKQPWIAARNIERLLAPGGLLFIQVPWVQAYHPFPEDYWRFSFAGIKSLFEQVIFDDFFYSGGSSDGIYRVLRDGRPAAGPDAGAVEAKLFQILLSAEENRAFLAGRATPHLSLSRGYLPVTVVNLVGKKSI